MLTPLRTLVAFLLILALTIGVICIYLYSVYSPATLQAKVLADSDIISPVLSPAAKESKWNLIDSIVAEELTGTSGSYGIAVMNLQTNENFFLNEHRKFKTASLYKLWVMSEAYRQIENNTLIKSTYLTDDVVSINKRFNIATESAEKTEGSVSMTVEDALSRMITYSDNYSALLLSTKLKLSNINSFLKLNQFIDSKVGTTLPITSAFDMVRFFEKLYRNEFYGIKSNTEMLALLKNQKIKRKLPRYLPTNTAIAHKTGELDGLTHDAGIVYSPSGDYIIVVLSESNDPKGAEEKIARISEGIYNLITTSGEY